MTPKILLFDIENSPSLAYIWQLKNDYISSDFIHSNWYMMCWAAKWLGDKKIMSAAICDSKKYDPDKPCDKDILGDLWKLLDEADIVIAHNAKAFDCKKANARFIKHGMPPPSPYRIIDTLSEARKQFMFTSNKLNELGKLLGCGEKIHTGGFKLWLDCMRGDSKAWDKMVRYCKNDVILLERVYLKMRPYMKTHPNISVIEGKTVCSRCGCPNITKRGVYYTQSSRKQRFQCNKCHGYGEYILESTRNV